MIRIVFYALFALLAVGTFFLSGSQQESLLSNANITLAGENFVVEVAQTEKERVMGLSERDDIGQGIDGLLFVFEESRHQGIWMKDMKFPIDIIWFDKDRTVVHIEENVSPDTFPKIFKPDQKSLYILEARAGFVQTHNIKIGDSFEGEI